MKNVEYLRRVCDVAVALRVAQTALAEQAAGVWVVPRHKIDYKNQRI